MNLLDIFNSLHLMSLTLALASSKQIRPIGSLLASASESDIKSNELKMSNSMML